MRLMRYGSIVLMLIFLSFGKLYAQQDIEQLLMGNHLLTLQWLQNYNGVGEAKIYKKDGVIYIEGYQEEKFEGSLNYMRIQGTLKILNPKKLEFEGKIVTKIYYLNNGAPYERNGKYLMAAHGTRKFWRMQDMTQPYNGFTVVDYIDLHFKKVKSK